MWIQCIGTEVGNNPLIFQVPNDPLVVRHSKQVLQIWAITPVPRRFRIAIVDYRELPRYRTVMGYIWFGNVPVDVEVSDYRISIGFGQFPELMKEGTVYILGVRFKPSREQTIPLIIGMHDHINGLQYSEHIDLVHVEKFFRSNRHPSLRLCQSTRGSPIARLTT